jgi:hypothetical protein
LSEERERLPWFKWQPDKWQSDERLKLCSLAARGLWCEMLGYMHKANPPGFLLINGAAPTITEFAAVIGRPPREVRSAHAELTLKGVFSVDSSGRIFSRRMVRDIERKRKAAEFGRLGGNPALIHPDNHPLIPRGERLEERVESNAKAGQELVPGAPAPAPSKGATKLPKEWELPDEWLEWTLSERPDWNEKKALDVSMRFRDYWLSNGKRMADWSATWRNWVRREGERNGGSGALLPSGSPAPLSPAGASTAAAAEDWMTREGGSV